MFGMCERNQFLNHALNMLWFVLKIFFKSEVILTYPFGLLSLFWPNFNLLGVIRSIVSKSETILPSAKSKSLILFAISAAQVSYWMTKSHSFNMVFLIIFQLPVFYIQLSHGYCAQQLYMFQNQSLFWLNLDLISQMSSFIDVHPLMSWLPSSGKSFLG